MAEKSDEERDRKQKKADPCNGRKSGQGMG